MPGRRLPDDPVDTSLCRRCQIEKPAITIRTEPLCKPCFAKYVQTKVVKRMESFRVRHANSENGRRLLLPLDFDACSLGLLHVLSQHIKGQKGKTGRTGFALCVLRVEVEGERKNEDAMAKIEARYPEHEYHSVPLSSVLQSEDLSSLFPEMSGDLAAEEPLGDRLDQVLKSLKSTTARQDTSRLLKQRLVVRSAKKHDCEAIIWPDSTTRLAERTLAETAKGRGYAIPWIVSDGESPHGVPFYFPLRELLTREIEAYVSFLDPPLEEGILMAEVKPVVSTKNTTIDDLMTQYFESVEQEYPSIVANVVRTTAKLRAPSLSLVEQQCELCNMPLEGHAPVKSRLCYGCIRNLPQTNT